MQENYNDKITAAQVKALAAWLTPLQSNGRIGPVHICVYLALIQSSAGHPGWFPIDRAHIMQLAKIKGETTYYRVLRDLHKAGLVEYWPSRCWKKESR
jgi:hypothetical protein